MPSLDLEPVLSMNRSEVAEVRLKNRESMLRKIKNQRSVSELIKVFEKVMR
jgi:hypothetical protein